MGNDFMKYDDNFVCDYTKYAKEYKQYKHKFKDKYDAINLNLYLHKKHKNKSLQELLCIARRIYSYSKTLNDWRKGDYNKSFLVKESFIQDITEKLSEVEEKEYTNISDQDLIFLDIQLSEHQKLYARGDRGRANYNHVRYMVDNEIKRRKDMGDYKRLEYVYDNATKKEKKDFLIDVLYNNIRLSDLSQGELEFFATILDEDDIKNLRTDFQVDEHKNILSIKNLKNLTLDEIGLRKRKTIRDINKKMFNEDDYMKYEDQFTCQHDKYMKETENKDEFQLWEMYKDKNLQELLCILRNIYSYYDFEEKKLYNTKQKLITTVIIDKLVRASQNSYKQISDEDLLFLNTQFNRIFRIDKKYPKARQKFKLRLRKQEAIDVEEIDYKLRVETKRRGQQKSLGRPEFNCSSTDPEKSMFLKDLYYNNIWTEDLTDVERECTKDLIRKDLFSPNELINRGIVDEDNVYIGISKNGINNLYDKINHNKFG